MQATNIAGIVEQIHEKVAHERRSNAYPRSSSRKWPRELSDLRAAYEQVYRLRNSIGRLPPRPNTARAWIGQWAVRIVQRMLFWYTPQISRFNSAVMLTLDQTCALLAECLKAESVQNEAREEVGRELALLLARLSSLEGRLNALQHSGNRVSSESRYAESKPLIDAGSDLDDFHFCLQDNFRGPEGDTRSKLRYYLPYIHQDGSTQLDGRWLDIGCGRGEWIQLAAEEDIDVTGLDSNRIAVAYCHAKGLEVEEADALTFLRQVPEKSLSGVTAFHTVEHWQYRGMHLTPEAPTYSMRAHGGLPAYAGGV